MDRTKQAILCESVRMYFIMSPLKIVNIIIYDLLIKWLLEVYDILSNHLSNKKKEYSSYGPLYSRLQKLQDHLKEVEKEIDSLNIIKNSLLEFKIEHPNQQLEKINIFCDTLEHMPPEGFKCIAENLEEMIKYAKSVSIESYNY